MERSIDRRIVGMDGVIAASSIGIGVMVISTAGFPTEFWWVGVAVAVVTGVLTAAADRSRVGLWAMVSAGIAGIVALVALVGADPRSMLVPGVVSLLMIGLGVGSGCNRFVFGIVRPVPEPRRKRA